LSKNRFISSIIAGLLVLLTLLSITPKHFLHDAFADHIDQKDTCSHRMDDGIHQSYHGCDTANFVAETPFTPTHAFAVTVPTPIYTGVAIPNYPAPLTSFMGYCCLRGPPALV
jgi:hypothetical protein